MNDLLSYDDYKKLLEGPHAAYYRGRWAYYKEVIDIISGLEIENVIELGPGYLPIVKNADLMLSPDEDQFGRPERAAGKVIVHDATTRPWPAL